MMGDEADTSELQSALTYYKDKVEALENERQAWLSKFDECAQKLNQKQEKEQKLRSLKDQNDEAEKDILHHKIASFDESLNSLNVDRENQNLEFEEAEQLIRLKQLGEQFPAAVGSLQKQLPCLGNLSGDIIHNDLNIHSNPNYKSKNPPSKKPLSSAGKKNPVTGGQRQSSQKQSTSKKTLQQLLELKIIETEKLNEKQIQIMKYQQQLLEDSIREFKAKQKAKVEGQRSVVKQFNKKYKELEQKHKKLAESYFEYRQRHKQRLQNTREEHQKLKITYETLEKKVTEQLRVYEKENKAKQALILRKSQDFQQDYKAKMRAKERNLLALKENYERMQEMCIDKVRKLEATVEKVHYQLKDAEQRRHFLLTELREQLRALQKRCNEQRIQKARLDLKLKKRMEEEQIKIEEERERERQQQKANERQQLLKTAYKKTALPKSKKNKENKKSPINNAQSSGDEDSLQISDIDNIRKQINELEKKIAADEK